MPLECTLQLFCSFVLICIISHILKLFWSVNYFLLDYSVYPSLKNILRFDPILRPSSKRGYPVVVNHKGEWTFPFKASGPGEVITVFSL